MRWIWALAVACLVAAAPVRPEPRTDGGRTASLEVAPAALPVAGQRRDHGGTLELRLSPVVLATVVDLDPPATFALVRTPARPLGPELRTFSSRSSRGPPLDAAS